MIPSTLKEIAVSYMGIGGSDWATRIQCDFANQALTPKWTLIHNDCFQWSLGIMMNDELPGQGPSDRSESAQAAQKILDGTTEIPLGIIGEDYKSAPRASAPTVIQQLLPPGRRHRHLLPVRLEGKMKW